MSSGSPLAGVRHLRRTVMVTAAAVLVATTLPGVSSAAPVPGSAGVDTSLPATDSQQTVSGRDRFSELKVTVNQTTNLVNQAVSIGWTGGTATASRGKAFGEHFLQMFQCWGDDDGTNPANPGPPPEQCQQGASNGVFGGRSSLNNLFDTGVLSRATNEPSAVFKPFRAVDGTVIPEPIDGTYTDQIGVGGGTNYWINPFFNVFTTNEIGGARTALNGTGSELFEVTTGIESTGLGCGKSAQKLPDDTTKVPRCWLVVVPRGSAADENGGTRAPTAPVGTSPLAPLSWKNRIAIPLEFNPIDGSCPLAAEQRRIVGSELVGAAVSSWQPALCATPGLPPYAFGAVSDSQARRQLVSGAPGSAGLAAVGRPIDPTAVDPGNPVVYAPLAVSGTAIGFTVERRPKTATEPGEVTVGEELRGVRVAQMNLTPRLVAKLLTQSYRSQIEISGSKPPYPWSTTNPVAMHVDPDFLQFNPEFTIFTLTEIRNLGGLVLPAPGSDAALQVWEWVLADPEAKAWLAGTPDPSGMKVNPVFSTSPEVHPEGISFGDPLPDVYPKSDPYCYQGPEVVNGTVVATPPPLCTLDWLPYTQSLRDAARAARAANDGAKISVNPGAVSPDQVYKNEGPQTQGERAILAITDTAAAAQFGLQVARLSRAGDNGADRSFIAPDAAGLAAGARALAARDVPGFLEPNPKAAPPGAYPLTALTYAAVTPLSLDAAARTQYAAFVDYAAGPGQVRGAAYGQLPNGYEPLPEELRAQGRAAATAIRDLKADAADAEADADADEEAPEPTAGSDDSSPSDETGTVASTDDPTTTPTSGGAGGGAVLLPSESEPPTKNTIERIVEAVATPVYRLAATRYALPVLVVVALLSALGALELSKRRSRRGRSLAEGSPALPTEPADTTSGVR